MDLTIGMTAKDAVEHFTALKAKAEAAIANGVDGKPAAFEYTIYGEGNYVGKNEITLRFDNDDMERPEMSGRTIVSDD